MADRYCGSTDLLIGDVSFSSTSLDKFVNIAADEIDAELGTIYAIPLLPAPGYGSIASHVTLTLKRVNALIATGRLILDRATAGEDENLHAYGAACLKEGQGILKQIVCGSTPLIGVLKVAPHGGPDSDGNAPSIQGGDAVSGVDAFYEWVNRSEPFIGGGAYWRPGS